MRWLIAFLLLSNTVHAQTGFANEFYKKIERQFRIIDSVGLKDSDLLEAENEKIPAIIRQYKDHILNFNDTLDYDLVYIAISEDRNFALVSWDTRMGGTMIDFATMAIYRTAAGVKASMLVDSVEDGTGNTLMHYNKVHTIKTTSGRKFYLAWGNGQGSTALPWQELRAFSIVKNELTAPNVFPGQGSSIFISFDTHAFKEGEKIPTIGIRDGGKTLHVPIPTEESGFTGKYRILKFNGKEFSIFK